MINITKTTLTFSVWLLGKINKYPIFIFGRCANAWPCFCLLIKKLIHKYMYIEKQDRRLNKYIYYIYICILNMCIVEIFVKKIYKFSILTWNRWCFLLRCLYKKICRVVSCQVANNICRIKMYILGVFTFT